MFYGLSHEVIIVARGTDIDRATWIDALLPLYRQHSKGATAEKVRERLMVHRETEVDLLRDGERLIAFGICVPMTFSDTIRCVYRYGTVIDAAWRSRGLYLALMRAAIARHTPQYCATRTQSARVYESWRRFFGDALFPHPTRTPPYNIQRLARELVDSTHLFDPRTLILHDVYAEDRRTMPYCRCREEWIECYFAEHLGPRDAFVLFARVESMGAGDGS